MIDYNLQQLGLHRTQIRNTVESKFHEHSVDIISKWQFQLFIVLNC